MGQRAAENDKTIKYQGYQELAYLHPNHFLPDRSVVEKYFRTDKPYFIIRFAKLKAHHDSGISGIDEKIADKIIQQLSAAGKIYITSERLLEKQFKPYCISIDPLDMHHVLAFATLYIGDSQTMAAEAGILGIPFIRLNDFVGRLSYLNEIEQKYQLGYGFKPNQEEEVYKKIRELLNMKDMREQWVKKRNRMLADKIDTAKFLTWLIENYPDSVRIMREDPDYQNKFK